MMKTTVCQFTPARKLIPKSKAVVSSELEYIGDRDLDEKAPLHHPRGHVYSQVFGTVLSFPGDTAVLAAHRHARVALVLGFQ